MLVMVISWAMGWNVFTVSLLDHVAYDDNLVLVTEAESRAAMDNKANVCHC